MGHAFPMEKDSSSPARLAFIAIGVIAFVWLGLFVILPAVTGKPGVAQQMQSDLEGAYERPGPS